MSLKENDIFNEAQEEIRFEKEPELGPHRRTFLAEKIEEVMPGIPFEIRWGLSERITEKHYKFLLWNYYNDKEGFKLKINDLIEYDKLAKQSN